MCEKDGLSVENVLAAGGLKRDTVQAPGATVLRGKAVALFEALTAASRRPDAAFRAGLHVPIHRSPELVQLFRHAPNLPALVAPLNSALGHICGGVIGVSVQSEYARLGFGFPMWNGALEESFYEAAAGVVVCALRTRFGTTWKPNSVLVGHKRTKPEVISLAGIRVVRGASDNAIILNAAEAFSKPPNSQSSKPVPGKPEPNPLLGPDATLVGDVRKIVFGRLSLMLDTELEDVSKMFDISCRTLKRRLSEKGTSLRAIVADIKIAEAKRLLSETNLSITEIADVLRYAHPPSFSRAFTRGVGQSPSSFRRSSAMLQD